MKSVLTRAGPQIKQALVFCDKRFQSHPLLSSWKKKANLKFYYLNAGEKSKSLETLPSHIKKIISLDKDFDKNSLCFISVGGGSLTDLTGFLASIYKRGLPVIHFPTTWLSALDSAQGGKTAINFQNVKNILGTYYFPKAVFVVHDFLKQNKEQLKQEALGELLKIALIDGGELYKKVNKKLSQKSDSPANRQLPLKNKNAVQLKSQNRWHQNPARLKTVPLELFIRPAIYAKMKIVRQDPFEKKSIRKKLNLGHTVGHILESCHSLSHGQAVLLGLLFSLNWSYYKGFINKNFFKEIKSLISTKKINKKIPLAVFKKLLKQDKKHRKGHKMDFVFIKKPGEIFVKSVLETELLKEAQRQGLI